jgi:hypothetical protein
MKSSSLSRNGSSALLFIVTLLFAGCASDTVVQQSYTAPGVSSIKFSKVLVVGLMQNDVDRRLAENTIVGSIRNVPTVASHKLLPGILGKDDKPALIQAIKDGQFDGVVVLHVTSSDTRVTQGRSTALPMEYLVFSGFYTQIYDVGAYYGSDTRMQGADRIFQVETLVFDAKTEKLLWSCTTKSSKSYIESQDVGAVCIEIARTLKEKLVSQQLVPASSQ